MRCMPIVGLTTLMDRHIKNRFVHIHGYMNGWTECRSTDHTWNMEFITIVRRNAVVDNPEAVTPNTTSELWVDGPTD